MWLRVILLATSAVVGGAALSRKVADKAVRGRVSKAVDIARAAAVQELGREVSGLVRERVFAILGSLIWKVAIIGAFYLLYRSHDMTVQGFQIAVLIMTGVFAVRDIYRAAPHIWAGYVFVRRHEWKPATALREFVAGVVFDRAYEKALAATSEAGARHVIALSSFTREGLSEEIAEAVRDVARGASIRIIRLRAALGFAAVAVASLAYGAFVALALAQV